MAKIEVFSGPQCGYCESAKALLRMKGLEFEDMSIDSVTRLVTVEGDEIMLTAKEFDLLWMLASHPRQVFNRDQLLDRVWGANVYVEERTVDVHVRRLRKALTEHGVERYIQTVRGAGYRFSILDA